MNKILYSQTARKLSLLHGTEKATHGEVSEAVHKELSTRHEATGKRMIHLTMINEIVEIMFIQNMIVSIIPAGLLEIVNIS